MTNISRRTFIKIGTFAAAGLTIVPEHVLGRSFGFTAPSDKLNIARIGVGGMGRRNLANMSTENIVALCDVNWYYADKTFKDYPNTRRFKDWRVMFDEIGSSIDAVMVATPDHTHADVTAHVITLGKHCYTQKPLTHSVYESRLLTRLAKKYKVATQMGNQGNSFDWCRQVAEWIQSGIIGDVYEVHCWTDRPIWPQGLQESKTVVKCPKTLDWDLVEKLAEQYGIKISVHNHPQPSDYWNPDNLLQAIAGRSKLIGSCADVGHWRREGLNQLDCLRKLEGRLISLHFKGSSLLNTNTTEKTRCRTSSNVSGISMN